MPHIKDHDGTVISKEDFEFVLKCLDQYLIWVPEHNDKRENVVNLIERWSVHVS